MIKHKVTLLVNNKPVFSKEGESYPTFNEMQAMLHQQIWQASMPGGGWQGIHQTPAGAKGSATFNISVSWECTFNGRAPRRPKDVIAKEKAEQAARGQARREREE